MKNTTEKKLASGKATGAYARAAALSGTRRSEIARQAAQARWANYERAPKPTPAEKQTPRRIPARVQPCEVITLLHKAPPGQVGRDCSMRIVLKGEVLRTYRGDYDKVKDRVTGYLDALTDLGMRLRLTESTEAFEEN